MIKWLKEHFKYICCLLIFIGLPCLMIFLIAHESYTERLKKEYLRGRNTALEECKGKYEEDLENRYNCGYETGYIDGYREFTDANSLGDFYSSGHEKGYENGNIDGFADAYNWDIKGIKSYAEENNLTNKKVIKELIEYIKVYQDTYWDNN